MCFAGTSDAYHVSPHEGRGLNNVLGTLGFGHVLSYVNAVPTSTVKRQMIMAGRALSAHLLKRAGEMAPWEWLPQRHPLSLLLKWETS
jgi:hypothetical protein